MSDGVNKVILLGNIGADPEIRYTASGQAVLNIRVATNSSWFDKEKQERQERTEWHNVVVWGPRAEALAKFLVKGMTLYVEGELRTSSFEKEGQKHYRVDVHSTQVIPAGGKGSQPAPQEAAPRAASGRRKPAARPAEQTGDYDDGGYVAGD